MNEQAKAYIEGWTACMQGEDGRFTNPYPAHVADPQHYAWSHGFLDAMEAEDGETPEPECAGYGS